LLCSDSHRFDYVGYAGAHWLETPNLDRLTERATVFTQCITNAPVCIPARSALASGLAPHRFGALHNRDACLPRGCWTLYRALAEAGYWTAFTGKLHVRAPNEGEFPPDGRRPSHMLLGLCDGFECGQPMKYGTAASHPYRAYLEQQGLLDGYNADRHSRREGQPPPPRVKHADSSLPFEHRIDSFLVRRAIERMGEFPSDRPWFHQVNLTSPHPPSDPSVEMAEQYRNADCPAPVRNLTGKPGYIHRGADTYDLDDVRFAQRQYSAHVAELDRHVGALLDALADRGELDKTLVLYTSDHGEMLGDQCWWYKHLPYEPSIHVPLLIAGPGVPEGQRCDALIEWIDLNPTLCQSAGAEVEAGLHARSFLPVLQGRTQTHRPDTLSVHDQFWCLRTDRYKLVVTINDQDELYDLQDDPRETRNLLAHDPAVVQSVEADLRGRLKERMIAG
jgi:choline-sulfatase